MKVHTIVFDLGGVILPLDRDRCAASFRKLRSEGFEETYQKKWDSGFFDLYEKGEMTSGTFVSELDAWLKSGSQPVIEAWNSLFLQIPPEHIEVLKDLAEDYTLFLLSNTNKIHIDWVNDHLRNDLDAADFGGVFKQKFLSYEMKMRKPDEEIFRKVQSEIGLKNSEFIFIEDTQENLEGAVKSGWQVLPHQYNSSMISLPEKIRKFNS